MSPESSSTASVTSTGGGVVVVGGGLAGLTAATYAARSGAEVTLIEARRDPGGRARSEMRSGFLVNQGPHALYKGGAAAKVLRDLGVRVRGRTPPLWHGWLSEDGRLHDIRRPGTVGWAAARGAAAALAPGAAARCDRGMSLREWLDAHVPVEGQDRVRALFRVSTYADAPDVTDAAASLTQLHLGAKGVTYLHGGWQTIVDGLLDAAAYAGVHLVEGAKVTGVHAGSTGATVLTEPREYQAASVVIAAGGPGHAATLLSGASATVDRWAREALPVHAACLDTSLTTLSRPRYLAVLGSDRPLYQIVHTAAADLAPSTGGELIHSMWYEPGRWPDVDHRAELESLLDLSQPGWREVTIDSRFSRQLVVAHDRPRPRTDPDANPTVAVSDLQGVFVAGDWLTARGPLADAAIGSARDAGVAAARVALGDRRPSALAARA